MLSHRILMSLFVCCRISSHCILHCLCGCIVALFMLLHSFCCCVFTLSHCRIVTLFVCGHFIASSHLHRYGHMSWHCLCRSCYHNFDVTFLMTFSHIVMLFVCGHIVMSSHLHRWLVTVAAHPDIVCIVLVITFLMSHCDGDTGSVQPSMSNEMSPCQFFGRVPFCEWIAQNQPCSLKFTIAQWHHIVIVTPNCCFCFSNLLTLLLLCPKWHTSPFSFFHRIQLLWLWCQHVLEWPLQQQWKWVDQPQECPGQLQRATFCGVHEPKTIVFVVDVSKCGLGFTHKMFVPQIA